MKLIRSLWKSIRRNPVINAFLLAVGLQIAHDWLANQIDWTNIAVYLSTVCMAVFTREFTVPVNEHETAVADARMKALAIPRPTPGIEFPGDANG